MEEIEESIKEYFTGRVGDDRGRKYIVTDGVLYEDEWPLLFNIITKSNFLKKYIEELK